MGLGTITVPLFLATLPEGMSFTLNSITKDVPEGFLAHESLANGISLPHTFEASDITAGHAQNKRGARIVDLSFRTDGWGLHGGQGASFVLKFTISGRPTSQPDAPEQKNAEGSLTIGTSEWGVFSRPDQTIFSWQIGDKHRTYTAETPTLTTLDDSCLVVAWLPDQKTYVFGVDNKQDFIVKLMQGAVTAILAGHMVVWSRGAGLVAAIGGAVVAVVAFGAGHVDGI